MKVEIEVHLLKKIGQWLRMIEYDIKLNHCDKDTEILRYVKLISLALDKSEVTTELKEEEKND